MARAEIRSVLEKGLEASGVAGFAAAALAPDGEIHACAVGRRSLASERVMEAEDVFWIASMTKAVTSLAALQLVDEGKIGLDDPVGGFLPELAAPQVLVGFDDAGSPKLRPARTAVTLRTLLAHTSGLAYNFVSADLDRWLTLTGQDLLGSAPPSGMPLLFDPGDGWVYGIGVDFAGRLIEALAGADLESELKRRIFDPLGMSDTGFGLTETSRARRAGMHLRTADGAVAPSAFELPPPPFFQQGGGGLYSTAPDYLRFLRAQLPGGRPLLSPATAALFTRSQLDDPRPGAFKSVAPQLSGDFDAFPGQATGWSLGFLVNTEAGPAGRSAGSLAWAGLSNCYYWLDLESRACGVLLTQLLPFADAAVLSVFADFEAAVYGGSVAGLQVPRKPP